MQLQKCLELSGPKDWAQDEYRKQIREWKYSTKVLSVGDQFQAPPQQHMPKTVDNRESYT